MELTIVVASVEGHRRIGAALETLRATSAGLDAEIIVVDASTDNSSALARAVTGVRVLCRKPGTLVPVLWADGIRLARGRIIATTTAHTVVGKEWARALIEPFSNPAVGGVGGPMRLAADASPTDAAVFFLRYSAFLPSCLPEGVTPGELAGDNAAYRRDDLLRVPSELDKGFWELPFHRLLRARGRVLVVRSAASATFGHAFPFRVIAAHRFHHGRQYAAERVASRERSRWIIVGAAPLVPALLTARAVRRALADPEHRTRVLEAMPGLLALGAAWAAGETAGALTR